MPILRDVTSRLHCPHYFGARTTATPTARTGVQKKANSTPGTNDVHHTIGECADELGSPLPVKLTHSSCPSHER